MHRIFTNSGIIHINVSLREVVKKRPSYGQADNRKRGHGSAPSALTVINCENFDPFLALKLDSLILKTQCLCKG